jgi:hypothetical protein
MKKFIHLSLAVSLLVILGVFTATNAQTEGQGAPEIIKHGANPHDIGSAPTAGGTGVVTPAITYHNGPLISTPTIYYIFYGNWNQANGSDNANGVQILKDFAAHIGGSPYFQLNTTYSMGSYNITGGVDYNIDLNNVFDSYSRGKRLRDGDILTIVTSAIGSGALPYNPNGVYFVLTSSDVTETSGFCTKYCGWHTSANSSFGGRVRYSFVGNANRCLNACAAQTVSPNSNAGVDGMISVIAHELEEATTDPDPRSGWADSGGAENADKCAWTFGHNLTQLPSGAYYNMTLGTRNFLIQRNLEHHNSGDLCKVSATQN